MDGNPRVFQAKNNPQLSPLSETAHCSFRIIAKPNLLYIQPRVQVIHFTIKLKSYVYKP